MKKIQMVDLKSQYNIIQEEIDKVVLQVIRSAQFIKGPDVHEFESELKDYLQAKHVITCGNGTDALQIALMALNLKPGDEVITPCFTYAATAEVIALLHLKPVLVDVYSDTFDINIKALEKAITPKTKAIVPVHLFGQASNMEAIVNIAKKHNIFIVEDTAQAIGSDYFFNNGSSQKLGTIGNIGCTSFFPSKNLGCYGDGGAMYTNDDELASRMRQIANHGQTQKYVHDSIGVNSRLDSIQAAVLRVKLKHLDRYAVARNKVASLYDKAFKNHSKLQIPKRVCFSNHVFHQYTLQLINVDRDKLRAYLASKEIPSMVYYPIPLHFQKAYKNGYKKGDFPVTEKLCKSVLSLPIHTEMSNEQIEFITSTILEYLNKK